MAPLIESAVAALPHRAAGHPADQVPEKHKFKQEQREPKLSNLEMNPLFSLKQDGAPRGAFILLVLAVASAVLLGIFASREFSVRKRTMAELAQAEQARARLEQSVEKLTVEVQDQREEIARLAADLEAANAKAAMIDVLRLDHQAEISRLKNSYDAQVATLRKSLEFKEDIAQTFESNLKSIRKLLEGSQGVSFPVMAAGPVAVSPGEAPAAATLQPEPIDVLARSPIGSKSGSVLMVNRQNRFIIVNLGPAQGATPGRFIQVYQKGKPLGEARIERVYQNLSAATVLSQDVIERVRKGDEAFLALS